jgi:hypothetical protein
LRQVCRTLGIYSLSRQCIVFGGVYRRVGRGIDYYLGCERLKAISNSAPVTDIQFPPGQGNTFCLRVGGQQQLPAQLSSGAQHQNSLFQTISFGSG